MKAAKRVCMMLGICFLLLFGACAGPVSVTVGVPDNETPLGYVESGERAGFEVDLAREAGRRAGFTVRFVTVESTRAAAALAAHQADAVLIPETAATADTLLTEACLRDRLEYLTPAEGGVASARAAAGRAVGVVTDSPAQRAVQASGLQKTWQNGAAATFVDLDTALSAMDAGQVAATVLYRTQALSQQQANTLKYRMVDAAPEADAFSQQGLAKGLGRRMAVGVRRNDARLRNRFQQALDEMEKDGTLRTLSQKWFGEDLTVKTAASSR